MGFQHPQQLQHMIKGVKAAVSLRERRICSRTCRTVGGPSLMGPDDDEPMEAAGRTPEFNGDTINQQAGQPMGESLAQEAMAGNARRSVSKRRTVQLDKPGMNLVMKLVRKSSKSDKA